jgi:hypothetical protein
MSEQGLRLAETSRIGGRRHVMPPAFAVEPELRWPPCGPQKQCLHRVQTSGGSYLPGSAVLPRASS